jgi:signal transduction histidine kinase
LVVEDDAALREVLRDVLERAGYAVAVAADGTAGIQRVREGRVALILLDLMLPEVDGLEVCRRLRDQEAEGYTPIIMVTALARAEDRHAGFAAGADDYIAKPFETDDLLDRVHAWMLVRDRLDTCLRRVQQLQAAGLRDQIAHAETEVALRAREELVAVVSHELKTPIAVMKGFAQYVMRRRAYDADAMQRIVDQARVLERLIDDLLTATSGPDPRRALQCCRIELTALVRATAAALQASHPTHTIRVETPRRALDGWWDADRIREILENLLANAVKYSASGSTVLVRVEDEGEAARVDVCDRGIGIPPDEQDQIFERFYRGASRAQYTQGLGLGLYIARQLVDAHGGRIWAESAGEGEGSRFCFTLPYTQPPSA